MRNLREHLLNLQPEMVCATSLKVASEKTKVTASAYNIEREIYMMLRIARIKVSRAALRKAEKLPRADDPPHGSRTATSSLAVATAVPQRAASRGRSSPLPKRCRQVELPRPCQRQKLINSSQVN